jgi:WD40 repeat protein
VAAAGEVREYIGEYQAYEENEELEEDSRDGIYRWNVEAILRNQGRKSDRHLLPAAKAKIFPMPPLPHPLALQEEGFLGYSFSMIFSPDGSKLAAALWNRRVLCWEFPSGKPLPELRIKNPGNAYPFRLAFSPDSKMLAVATEIVTLYEISSMTPTITLSLPKAKKSRNPSRISSIAFHPSQQLLATVSNDSVVRSWDATTGAEKETFDWKIGKVSAVAFSQDGCLCGAAGEKGIAIWDVS